MKDKPKMWGKYKNRTTAQEAMKNRTEMYAAHLNDGILSEDNPRIIVERWWRKMKAEKLKAEREERERRER